MGDVEQMNRIVACWALAEKRAKHLCAFETLGLNIRCRWPSSTEVRKAWHRLCMRMHPDKNVDSDELASEATRCLNAAKQYLFEDYFTREASLRAAPQNNSEQASTSGSVPPTSGKRPPSEAPDPSTPPPPSKTAASIAASSSSVPQAPADGAHNCGASPVHPSGSNSIPCNEQPRSAH